MSDHIDDLKKRLNSDPEIVIVEEELESDGTQQGGSSSIVDELGRLGRKLAESAQTARESDQVEKWQADLKQGWSKFQQEAGRVVGEVREDAEQAAERIRNRNNTPDAQANESGGTASTSTSTSNKTEQSSDGSASERFKLNIDKEKTRDTMVNGLRWLSSEMGRMADRFQESGSSVDDQIRIDPD